MRRIELSALAHTWLVDIDGTIVKHNGHKRGGDELLPGVAEFWAGIPAGDVVVLLSARTVAEAAATLRTLAAHGLRHDHSIFGLPTGERVLINDMKPQGLATAIAVNLARDAGLAGVGIDINPNL
ncbi:hypothetical protein CSQ96_07165 [Janthinobacterium sp. BJB412]|jgi:hypothetical protein|nr:hypothetical protein CSQ96_07165 [Janthinobacterium sp. BJB412]